MNVILHVFSNSILTELLTLGQEKEALSKILTEREAQQEYRYITLVESTLDEVEDALREHKRDLIAFQFSGHAGENSIVINDLLVNGEGLAMALEESATKFSLKLVVINGCSSDTLVDSLTKRNVPAIVSTSAAVLDESATFFSIHFWRALITYNMNIRNAFNDALGAAQSRSPGKLASVFTFHGEKAAIQINPIHFIEAGSVPNNFVPNSLLYPELFREFQRVGNEEVTHLPQSASKGARMAAMLNSIPHPLSTHLQKLFSPFESSPEGYDKITLKRLQQIGQLYQNASEFCWYIIVAQLWDIMLQFPSIRTGLSLETRKFLWSFFTMKTEPLETFDFIPEMRSLLQVIQDLSQDPVYKSYIDKQIIYQDFLPLPESFFQSCSWLNDLRHSTYNDMICGNQLQFLCESAERRLLDFLKNLSFMHRYKLTSIQDINVIKLRHTKPALTRYKHKMTFLMNARGGEELSYYYMRSHIDTWSVILIKGEKRRKANMREEPTFVSSNVEFLNLSPFVIDQNIYLKNTNLSDIMFFRGFLPNGTAYRRVSDTLDKKDIQVMPIGDNYSPLTKQFSNFKKTVLGTRP